MISFSNFTYDDTTRIATATYSNTEGLPINWGPTLGICYPEDIAEGVCLETIATFRPNPYNQIESDDGVSWQAYIPYTSVNGNVLGPNDDNPSGRYLLKWTAGAENDNSYTQFHGEVSILGLEPEQTFCEDQIMSRVINGQEVNPAGKYPWMVSIQRNQYTGEHFCGGVLIDNQWILTAAHCLCYPGQYDSSSGECNFYFTPGMVRFHFGLHNQNDSQDSQIYFSDYPFVIHPNHYKLTLANGAPTPISGGLVYDYALVYLNEPVDDIFTPISLISDDTHDNDSELVRILGWGLTENGLPSDVLRQAPMIINDECGTLGGSLTDEDLPENPLSYLLCLTGLEPAGTIYGCTNPNAYNYNLDATNDLGTCLFDEDCYFTCVSDSGDVLENEGWVCEHTGIKYSQPDSDNCDYWCEYFGGGDCVPTCQAANKHDGSSCGTQTNGYGVCSNYFDTCNEEELAIEFGYQYPFDYVGTASCNGDSGGPAIIINDDCEYELVGISSFSQISNPPCMYPGDSPSVYARIRDIKDWIIETTSLGAPDLNPYAPGQELDIHYYDGAYLDNNDIVLDIELNHMAGHNYFDGALTATLRSLVDSGKHIFMVLDRTGCSSCYDKMAEYAEIIEEHNLTERDDVVIMSILSDTATGSHSFESWSANGNDLVAVIDGGDTFFGIGTEVGHPFYQQFIWDHPQLDESYIGYGGNFIMIDLEERVYLQYYNDMSISQNNLNAFVEMIGEPEIITGDDELFGCHIPYASNYDAKAINGCPAGEWPNGQQYGEGTLNCCVFECGLAAQTFEQDELNLITDLLPDSGEANMGDDCGEVPEGTDSVQYMIRKNNYINQNLNTRDIQTHYSIPIIFHDVYGGKDGIGEFPSYVYDINGESTAECKLFKATQVLSEQYLPGNISFYRACHDEDGNILSEYECNRGNGTPIKMINNHNDYIESGDYYNSNNHQETGWNDFNYFDNVINVYVSECLINSISCDSGLGGFANRGRYGDHRHRGLAIRQSTLFESYDSDSAMYWNVYSNWSTFGHELGHTFNGYHLFQDRYQIELVDLSNCDTEGDFICDTETQNWRLSFADESQKITIVETNPYNVNDGFGEIEHQYCVHKGSSLGSYNNNTDVLTFWPVPNDPDYYDSSGDVYGSRNINQNWWDGEEKWIIPDAVNKIKSHHNCSYNEDCDELDFHPPNIHNLLQNSDVAACRNTGCYNTSNGKCTPLPAYTLEQFLWFRHDIEEGDPDQEYFGLVGCTDRNACNWAANWVIHDESQCDYGDGTCGCTDETAWNYNGSKTEDNGSCLYTDENSTSPFNPLISGCTDPTACNYSSYVTIDDGSCEYPLYECTCTGEMICNPEIDSNGFYNSECSQIVDDCGVCFDEESDPYFNTSCCPPDSGANNAGTICENAEAYSECCEWSGCTNMSACNFKNYTNLDCYQSILKYKDKSNCIEDGSCLYIDECGECGGNCNPSKNDFEGCISCGNNGFKCIGGFLKNSQFNVDWNTIKRPNTQGYAAIDAAKEYLLGTPVNYENWSHTWGRVGMFISEGFLRNDCHPMYPMNPGFEENYEWEDCNTNTNNPTINQLLNFNGFVNASSTMLVSEYPNQFFPFQNIFHDKPIDDLNYEITYTIEESNNIGNINFRLQSLVSGYTEVNGPTNVGTHTLNFADATFGGTPFDPSLEYLYAVDFRVTPKNGFIGKISSISLDSVTDEYGKSNSCFWPTGCTDVEACNYNPEASEDDGSCLYPNQALGCTCEDDNFRGYRCDFSIKNVCNASDCPQDMSPLCEENNEFLNISFDGIEYWEPEVLPQASQTTYNNGVTINNFYPNFINQPVLAYTKYATIPSTGWFVENGKLKLDCFKERYENAPECERYNDKGFHVSSLLFPLAIESGIDDIIFQNPNEANGIKEFAKTMLVVDIDSWNGKGRLEFRIQNETGNIIHYSLAPQKRDSYIGRHYISLSESFTNKYNPFDPYSDEFYNYFPDDEIWQYWMHPFQKVMDTYDTLGHEVNSAENYVNLHVHGRNGWVGEISRIKLYKTGFAKPTNIDDCNPSVGPPASGESGCTDPAACNYDAEVEFDDGSCYYDNTLVDCYEDVDGNGTYETHRPTYLTCDYPTCTDYGNSIGLLYNNTHSNESCYNQPVMFRTQHMGGFNENRISNNPNFRNNPMLGDCNGDGYIDLTDILGIERMISNNEYHECADTRGRGKIDTTDLLTIIDMVLDENNLKHIKPNNLESIDIRRWVRQTNTRTGVFKRGLQVNKMNTMSQDMMMSPVTEQGLYTDGNEFIFKTSRKPYRPGNSTYNRYNGEYHIHEDGSICAGPHDMGYVIPTRILIRR